MELTGKCKKDFEKWYLKQDYCSASLTEYSKSQVLKMFICLADPFKYGVLIDFFGENNIIIDIQPILDYNENIYVKVLEWLTIVIGLNIEPKEIENDSYKTRNQARESAIKQANKMYNSRE